MPGFSGGAIFHTGFLRIVRVVFEGNEAGAEGNAIFSIGMLEEMTGVVFSKNLYHCPVGKYSYIAKAEEVSTGYTHSASVGFRDATILSGTDLNI